MRKKHVEPFCSLLSGRAETFIESHRQPPSRCSVEQGANSKADAEHFFEAQCLRTELHSVGEATFRQTPLVFDRKRQPHSTRIRQRNSDPGLGTTKLDDVGLPSEPKPKRPERNSARDANVATHLTRVLVVHPFMHA